MKHTCEEIRPLLAAYALEALGPEERLRVEAHLAECAACRAALAGYQAVAEGLALSVPPEPPPSRLRRRLAARIAAPRRSRPGARVRRVAAVGWRVAVWVVLAVMLVLQAITLQRTMALNRTAERLAAQNAAYQAALALLSAPDAHVAVFRSEGVYGTLIYRPEDSVAVLSVEGLPAPPPGKAYQLWLIRPDGTRVSGGVFAPAGEDRFTVVLVRAPGPVGRFVRAGVTLEPEGGSPGPTGPRIFGGDL